MRFTLNWLKNHLDTTASDAEICEALTHIGLELEEFEDVAAQYAPFKVALIESAEKHPDADKLKVCKIKTDNGVEDVVCGAPNARAGMKGIFAPAGTYIAGLDVTLKKSKIRGVPSNGMMVSEAEMQLSDDSEGIIEVDDSYAIGTPMAEVFGLNEKIIEIGLTPNRADCAGVYGIARDLAAAGLGTLKPVDTGPVDGTFDSPIAVTIDDTDGCKVFYGRVIKNITNGASPAWLQNTLKAVGLRPISALVDITNLMTLDHARPLHVYDVDKLQGNITVRQTQDGETLDALNDKSYALQNGSVGIADNRGIIGLGGIVGGESTGVDENTVNVFVESAYFDPMRIARSGRDLGVSSDARYRFERGVDPAFTESGLHIATLLIQEICGTTTTSISHVVKAGEDALVDNPIAFDPAFTHTLCGLDIPADTQIAILEKLGFTCVQNGDTYTVTPPSWRGDVHGKADLVEEVVRIYGVDKIQPVSVRSANTVTAAVETPRLARSRMARAAMASLGYLECVTWSFMRKETAAHFGSGDNPALTLLNPISADLDHMRPSILPNLIDAAHRNAAKGYPDVMLCEVGPVFHSAAPEGQATIAAGIRAGSHTSRHWDAATLARKPDIYDVKADALAVLASIGAPATNARVARTAPSYYHPGRSGTLSLGKNTIAQFGEIHPAILEQMGIKETIVAFEVFIDAVPAARQKGTAKPLLKIAPLQAFTKDFAFIVKDDVNADDILRAALAADKKRITGAEIFDVYAGKGIDEGHKSLALSITIQPQDTTLTDEDIDTIMNDVIGAVSDKCGGVLRDK